MKITWQLLAAALVLAVSATGFAAEENSSDQVDEVVATIDGDPIFRSEILAQFNPQLENDLIELAKQDPKQAMLENQRIEHEILNQIIGRRLMIKVAQRDGYDVSDEELGQAMTEMVQQQLPNATLEQFLEKSGIPPEQFRAAAHESVVLRKLVEAHTADVPDVPLQTLQDYYKKHGELFHRLETLRARHILFSTEGLEDPAAIEDKLRQAEDLHAYLQKNPNANFAALAAQLSEGPSAPRGGDVGEFSRGMIDPDFEDAAFQLKVGEISGVVKTRVGFHIIKLEKRNPPRMLKFEEIREDLERDFNQRAKSDKMRWLLERWREEADIQFVGPAAKSVAPKSEEAPPASE